MVITMPASLATLYEVAMAAAGVGFKCVGESSLTSEYIVNASIEQIREIVSKAAADAIEVAIPDEAKAQRVYYRGIQLFLARHTSSRK